MHLLRRMSTSPPCCAGVTVTEGGQHHVCCTIIECSASAQENEHSPPLLRRRHCQAGSSLCGIAEHPQRLLVRREANNPRDPNAVEVRLGSPLLRVLWQYKHATRTVHLMQKARIVSLREKDGTMQSSTQTMITLEVWRQLCSPASKQ